VKHACAPSAYCSLGESHLHAAPPYLSLELASLGHTQVIQENIFRLTGLSQSTTPTMGDTPHPEALSLSNADAAQWNRDLILAFQAELERNPEADLMSMFSDSYRLEHRNSQYRQLSYPAEINLRTLHELRDTLRDEPEVNVLSKFPTNYNRKITMATGPKVLPLVEKDAPEVQAPEFRTRLDLAETATVIFPLSKEVVALLAQFSEDALEVGSSDNGKALVVPLKQLLWNSPKLWENPVRGVVVKCNDDIVAKVILGNRDYTEYTSMEFLAERAPDIPAPRPYGLIAFGPFRVIFMSYIPGTRIIQRYTNREKRVNVEKSLPNLTKVVCKCTSDVLNAKRPQLDLVET
jgi:hypothetical protein